MVLPDSLSYQVVYDVSRGLPQDWWGPIIPLAMAALVVRLDHRPSKAARVFRKVFTSFAILLAIIIALFMTVQHLQLRSALKGGNVRVVEGTVTDFIPQKPILKHPEQFIVATPTGRYKYSYRSSVGTGGLNASHGRIRNGVRVRIADRDGTIVRLEIARDASGNTLTPELSDSFPEVVFLPEMFLRYGYTAKISGTKGMALRFVDVVSDTRCSDGVPCREGESGDAVAVFEMFDNEVGKQPFRLELHTNRELYGPFSDGDLVVDLTLLRPVPEGGHPISKSDYMARLMIGRRRSPPDRED